MRKSKFKARNPFKMTNPNSHILEYTGFYAQGREDLNKPVTALKIWEGFPCHSLMEIVRARMSQTILKT